MSKERIKEIQALVPLGNQITVLCRGGREISGILKSIDLDGIIVSHPNNGGSRIPASLIEGYFNDGAPKVQHAVVEEEIEELDTSALADLMVPEQKKESSSEPVAAPASNGQVAGADKGTPAVEIKAVGEAKVEKTEEVEEEKEEPMPAPEPIQPVIATPPPAPEIVYSNKVLAYERELEVNMVPDVNAARHDIYKPDMQGIHERNKDDKKLRARINQIRQSYKDAEKADQMFGQFGRVSSLIRKLRAAIPEHKKNADLHNLLGFFLFEEGQKFIDSQAAFDQAYILSEETEVKYLINAIVAADRMDSTFTAIFLLETYCKAHPITKDNKDLWYIFLRKLKEEGHFQPLVDLYDAAKEAKDLPEDQVELYFRAFIYLLYNSLGGDKIKEVLSNVLEEEDNWKRCDYLIKMYRISDYVSDSYVSFAYYKQETREEIRRAHGVVQKNGKDQREPLPEGIFVGTIHEFHSSGSWGRIKKTEDDSLVWFHITGVSDKELKSRLTGGRAYNMVVEAEMGFGIQNRPAAVKIKPQWSKDDLFKLAEKCYQRGDTNFGVYYIKLLIKIDPDYKGAKQLQERLMESENKRTQTKHKGPYGKAKRAQSAGKPAEEVIEWFKIAIEKESNKGGAIKDLASYYNQLGRIEEAIQLLEHRMSEIRDPRSVRNLIIPLYYKNGQYDLYIHNLMQKISSSKSPKEITDSWILIGNGYNKTEDWRNASDAFEKALENDANNLRAKFSLAIALTRDRKYIDAKKYLEQIIKKSPTIQAAQLENQINAAIKNESEVNFEVISDSAFTQVDQKVSPFAQHYLESLDLSNFITRKDGLDQQGRYIEVDRATTEEDLKKAKKSAQGQGATRPKNRGKFYLTAARILWDLGQGQDSYPDQMYEYLGRALVSYGDDGLYTNSSMPIETMQQWYAEAINAFEQMDRTDGNKANVDTQLAFIRYIFSTLGSKNMIPKDSKVKNIPEAIDQVSKLAYDPEKFFDEITHLIIHSNLAQKQLLNHIYRHNTTLDDMRKYFQAKYDVPASKISSIGASIREGWSKVAFKYDESYRQVKLAICEMEQYENDVLWHTKRMDAFDRVVDNKFLLELDRSRLFHMKNICATGIRYIEGQSYLVQDTDLEDMVSEGNQLIKSIEKFPTQLSIAYMLPVLKKLINTLEEKKEDLYRKSLPEIQVMLKRNNVNFRPGEEGVLEIDITVTNEKGRSPAQNFALKIIKGEDDPFDLHEGDTFSLTPNVLNGGEENYLQLLLKLKDKNDRRDFSLNVEYQYDTIQNETMGPFPKPFPVSMDVQEVFEPFENPYTVQGIVGKNMFYGRDRLIKEISDKIKDFRDKPQGDAYLMYGQKRIGKSSLLYYLKENLRQNPENIIAYIVNTGTILGDVQPYTAFLWEILTQIEDGLYMLNPKLAKKWKLPDRDRFFGDASFISYFNDIMNKLLRLQKTDSSFKNKQVILLVDEFTYFHKEVKLKNVPRSFMKNIKAFLQKNYFNAVLVGQDYAVKFIEENQNEFAAIEKRMITYLSESDARDLIEKPILFKGESRYMENAIKRILELTANSPFYIQTICQRIVSYLNERKLNYVTGAVVKRVTDQLTKKGKTSNPILRIWKFESLYNSGDVSDDALDPIEVVNVLHEIASNSRGGTSFKVNAISTNTRKNTPSEIVDILLKRDVLEKDRERQGYVRIKVGLFQEWLINNFEKLEKTEITESSNMVSEEEEAADATE